MLFAIMREPRAFFKKLARYFLFLLFIGSFFGTIVQAQQTLVDKTPLLVVISVDGMRPDYVTAADANGLKIPNLRLFLKEGTFADVVQGVVPTVTYPSHTTLMTGVWPVKHGIISNTVFDPLQKNYQAWYWYAEDIRVPTLWDAAAKAGRTTAGIQWPVTVGAHITWNIPEFWRVGTSEDAKLLHAVATPGLILEASAEIGDYRGGIDTTLDGDNVRGRYAEWILEKKHPALLVVHLTALDHIQHETGPFSTEAKSTIESIDEIIGKIRNTAERVAPGRTYFAIVSDHGFVRTDKSINFFYAFHEAGLFSIDEKEKIKDWEAMPWVTGGSAAIVLKNPENASLAKKVKDLLDKLAADPANGIDRILDAEELHKRGGFPNASFLVSLKPGWHSATNLRGPVVSSDKVGGTHGELPDVPELRSSFFLIGPGVPAGRSLGLIDMRDIAPTLAHEVGLSLPTADGKNLLP